MEIKLKLYFRFVCLCCLVVTKTDRPHTYPPTEFDIPILIILSSLLFVVCLFGLTIVDWMMDFLCR